eukprot:Pgem_evm1s19555
MRRDAISTPFLEKERRDLIMDSPDYPNIENLGSWGPWGNLGIGLKYKGIGGSVMSALA